MFIILTTIFLIKLGKFLLYILAYYLVTNISYMLAKRIYKKIK